MSHPPSRAHFFGKVTKHTFDVWEILFFDLDWGITTKIGARTKLNVSRERQWQI